MTVDELLKFQRALLTSVTGGTVLAAQGSAPGSEGWLGGMDIDRLRQLGRQVHAKRMGKIQTILPRTFRCLGEELDRLGSEFGAQRPPVTVGSFANACQFYHFLCRVSAPVTPYLLDLAYCELALVGVVRREPAPAPKCATLMGPVRVRRLPGVRWRRCRWNVRPLLEDLDMQPEGLEFGPVCLLFCMAHRAPSARILQVDEGLLELILSLGDWTTLQTDQWATGAGALITRLEQLGVVEVASCESA